MAMWKESATIILTICLPSSDSSLNQWSWQGSHNHFGPKSIRWLVCFCEGLTLLEDNLKHTFLPLLVDPPLFQCHQVSCPCRCRWLERKLALDSSSRSQKWNPRRAFGLRRSCYPQLALVLRSKCEALRGLSQGSKRRFWPSWRPGIFVNAVITHTIS